MTQRSYLCRSPLAIAGLLYLFVASAGCIDRSSFDWADYKKPTDATAQSQASSFGSGGYGSSGYGSGGFQGRGFGSGALNDFGSGDFGGGSFGSGQFNSQLPPADYSQDSGAGFGSGSIGH